MKKQIKDKIEKTCSKKVKKESLQNTSLMSEMGVVSTFWPQKAVLKNSMKFTRFIVYLLLKNH